MRFLRILLIGAEGGIHGKSPENLSGCGFSAQISKEVFILVC